MAQPSQPFTKGISSSLYHCVDLFTMVVARVREYIKRYREPKEYAASRSVEHCVPYKTCGDATARSPSIWHSG